ncbi:MAG: TatD family hydrolase [Treponema sp.]|nr:TatD family hydrolase [Treponema sp.]
MLEKNENILYFDAHFHLADCIYDGMSLSGLTRQSAWYACTCCHSVEEWNLTEGFRNKFGMTDTSDIRHAELVSASHNRLYVSYGLHPQSAGHINVDENAAFLEQLLQQNKLNAIGEAGFDYFNEEFKSNATIQEKMFNLQLELALQYNIPMVIHCRKANEKLFEYSRQLKKIPAVLFHSFMGMPNEAKSLLDRGINAYFSFGKQVMNNNKKVIACVRELPDTVLLTETDAPWQFLKSEKYTTPAEIKKIFEAFCQFRQTEPERLSQTFKINFFNLFSPKL